MSFFKKDDKAEIDVKKLILRALEEEKSKIEPYYTKLTLEVAYLKDEIKKLEEQLKTNT